VSVKNSEVEQRMSQKLKEEVNQQIANATKKPEVLVKLDTDQKRKRMN